MTATTLPFAVASDASHEAASSDRRISSSVASRRVTSQRQTNVSAHACRGIRMRIAGGESSISRRRGDDTISRPGAINRADSSARGASLATTIPLSAESVTSSGGATSPGRIPAASYRLRHSRKPSMSIQPRCTCAERPCRTRTIRGSTIG